MDIRIKTLGWLGVALPLFILAPASGAAKDDPVDLSAYPELSPEASLPRIILGLRRFLKDTQSISDFALCVRPRLVKFKDGKPVRWTYLFSLNARNAMGGYTGLEPYSAILYSDGRTTISNLVVPGHDGFSDLANSLIEHDMAKCPYLSHEQLKSLLDQNL